MFGKAALRPAGANRLGETGTTHAEGECLLSEGDRASTKKIRAVHHASRIRPR